MIVTLSPAKRIDTRLHRKHPASTKPHILTGANRLVKILQELSEQDLRSLMARFIIDQRTTSAEDLKGFDYWNYFGQNSLSDKRTVFLVKMNGFLPDKYYFNI